MASFKFLVSALRPSQGKLSKMVGAAALPQTGNRGAATQEQIVALQDQINALNTLARLSQQFVEVDGSALPFTPPGGTSGDIQTNDGAGGFAALASTGTGSAVRESSPTIDELTATGDVHLPDLPSVAGASGTLWYDPGDGDRVKYVP